MTPRATLENTLVTAAIATAVTTAAALFLGKKQLGSPAAPLNATSHIAWGDEAATRDQPDWKHTVVGGVLNAGAMATWAYVQHRVLPRPRSTLGAALTGAAVSALAYVTDYHLVPKRFTPGFEKRLSSRSLFAMYTALAAALGAGAAVARARS